ncbi:uroporphyrinogen decarboxylase family protein [Alkalibacter mobilis]|uniref:uroporphyrinogen decarboxylase family protein n=1 Tax=Alkalibacter mobilis TaxID=2787712 RepID=UPI00189EBC7D|nr:uroporphyrinogen decarboxylase family protein [Alkalibacter mobilis]MBF7096756.1 uroporphyrinogen decarboxylase [Alkalibacter mobilis]
MLTIRQNLLETIKGGNPDRFVKQFEFMELIYECPMGSFPGPGETIVNDWGITFTWPEGQVGGFPIHDEEHIVLKDITKWKEQVKIPPIVKDDAAWAPAVEHANKIDRSEKFVTAFVAPGLFEMTHHLMSMENALMAYYEDPDKMHELIEALCERELEYAAEVIKRIKPDCLFHHDDWGGQKSTFISPEMFEEFYLPYYKKIYKFYKDNGVEVAVHHSDSYAASFVPFMIEMGVDIWQGVMTTNNTPELVKKYGGQMSFMGDIDSGVVDFPGWNREIIDREVERACKNNGKLYFIPCLTQGGDYGSFPGVYEETSKSIDEMSKKMF